MLIRLFLFLIAFSDRLKVKLWHFWYQCLARFYSHSDWHFMNYGYSPSHGESVPSLAEEEEPNRLFIQLYDHVLADLDLHSKMLLEVGSGRGGGANYIARYFPNSSVTGLDFSGNAIKLCQQFYHRSNLDFVEGSAEKLPFKNASFDIVFNIESSHCYADMEQFVAEVFRVLKPGGVFAWADLRTQAAMERDDEIFKASPLKLLFKEDITPNVIEALDKISEQKSAAIRQRVPWFLRSLFNEFTGLRHSRIFYAFQNGSMVYQCYRLVK